MSVLGPHQVCITTNGNLTLIMEDSDLKGCKAVGFLDLN